MAEIDIEKKKAPVWPWIIVALLAIAAIIWWADDDNDMNATETEEVAVNENDLDNNMNADNENNDQVQAEEVESYVAFVNNSNKNIDVSHEYTHDALTKLADALEEVVDENNADLENGNSLKELRQQADQLTENVSSEKHANILSRAFTSAADIMENLQEKHYPDNKENVEEVKDAAQSIDPQVIVTDQKEVVHKFFDKAADALQEMEQNV